jgi:SAM-dependent methyltransferase
MGPPSIYDSGEYRKRNPEWHAEEASWKVAQIVRMLDRHHLHPGTVCDVGCGAGEVLAQLQRRVGDGCELWGYDVSPHALELCAPKANTRLHFQLGDPPPVGDRPRFDLLLILDVVEHVDDCYGFLRRLRGLGRHTLIHLPLDLSVQTVVRPRSLQHVREEYGHLHYFTRETGLSLLRDTGYAVVDSAYTARALEQPTRELRRRLMRWPRTLLAAISVELAATLLGGWSLLVLAT